MILIKLLDGFYFSLVYSVFLSFASVFVFLRVALLFCFDDFIIREIQKNRYEKIVSITAFGRVLSKKIVNSCRE